jgi:ubiquinone/menaquinone biosynthesis C-methylase UbiE
MQTIITAAGDTSAIKTRQQKTWTSGDYGTIGVRLQMVGESLCEAADIHAGEKVLDVAAGNGNASLAASRRFADVIATDYVPELLEDGRRRAEADRLPIAFEAADAERLPYEDGSFDVALSVFGVMFTPDQERAAAEMTRVVRRGGRIGLASWTATGFVGRMFSIVGSFVPPPAGLRSPTEWGSEPRIVELFGPAASDIQTERRMYMFRYASPRHWIDFFRANYGPMLRAFAGLDEAGRQALDTALMDLATEWNRSERGGLVVPAEYLEAVITKG